MKNETFSDFEKIKCLKCKRTFTINNMQTLRYSYLSFAFQSLLVMQRKQNTILDQTLSLLSFKHQFFTLSVTYCKVFKLWKFSVNNIIQLMFFLFSHHLSHCLENILKTKIIFWSLLEVKGLIHNFKSVDTISITDWGDKNVDTNCRCWITLTSVYYLQLQNAKNPRKC